MAKPISLPVWQSALLAHGCRLDIGSRTLPQQLEPVGACLCCTPNANGSMLPFNIPVLVGQTVTISWDDELSRYIVDSRNGKIAA